jgi:hypothetical protein
MRSSVCHLVHLLVQPGPISLKPTLKPTLKPAITWIIKAFPVSRIWKAQRPTPMLPLEWIGIPLEIYPWIANS